MAVQVFIAYSPKPGHAIEERHEAQLGLSISELLKQVSWYERHPSSRNLPVGIHGMVQETTALLRADDRIEFYRPLHTDPKNKRRQRVLAKKSVKH